MGPSILYALDNVNYDALGEVDMSHCECTNLLSNKQRLLQKASVQEEEMGIKTKSLEASRAENTVWMEEILLKFTKQGDLIADARGGTFSAPKACIELRKKKIFTTRTGSCRRD